MPHQPLTSYLELRDQYLSILLQQEALSHTYCHICKGQDKLYRCEDCFGSPLCCQSCLLQTHISSPFHRIQHWNGEFFQPAKLVNLGYTLHSGHGGLQCPHSTPDHDTLICIVDVIGVFHHKLRWCGCQSPEPLYAQLLRLGLYPSSMERPETAFTFSLLDYFHIDAVECKTSANNFYNKLRRLTNSLFPHKVPVGLMLSPSSYILINLIQDRYRELMMTSREWRDLLLRKRAGFGHDLNSKPGNGQLALFCPACPQPGINLPATRSDDPKYVANLFINFFWLFFHSHSVQMVVSQKHCC